MSTEESGGQEEEIRTTKRASERREAEEAIVRAAEHGRGRRMCLESARAANLARRRERAGWTGYRATDAYEDRARWPETSTGARTNGSARTGCRPRHVGDAVYGNSRGRCWWTHMPFSEVMASTSDSVSGRVPVHARRRRAIDGMRPTQSLNIK